MAQNLNFIWSGLSEFYVFWFFDLRKAFLLPKLLIDSLPFSLNNFKVKMFDS